MPQNLSGLLKGCTTCHRISLFVHNIPIGGSNYLHEQDFKWAGEGKGGGGGGGGRRIVVVI
jgi:hypothetical protein